jgi:hypothetical protein
MRGFPMSWAQGRLVRISRTNIFTELRVAASVVLPSKTPVMPRRRSGRLPALREFALRDRARRSRTTCGGDRTTDHGLLTGRGVRQSWRPGRCRPCRPVLLRYLRNSCRALSHDRLDSPPPVAGADLLLPAGERHLARPTSCSCSSCSTATSRSSETTTSSRPGGQQRHGSASRSLSARCSRWG